MVKREQVNLDPGAWALQAIDELEALKRAHQQYSEVLAVFRVDLSVYQDIADTDDRPFWGRTIVRSLLAGIEGLCYRVKHEALAAAALKNIELSHAELAMLREESYGLSDKGDAQSSKSKLRTAPNVAFTLRVLARARGGNYELDTNSTGWQAFKASIRVRDRVTHPKGAGDLEVSKDEISAAIDAATWFIRQHRTIVVATPIPNAAAAPDS